MLPPQLFSKFELDGQLFQPSCKCSVYECLHAVYQFSFHYDIMCFLVTFQHFAQGTDSQSRQTRYGLIYA